MHVYDLVNVKRHALHFPTYSRVCLICPMVNSALQLIRTKIIWQIKIQSIDSLYIYPDFIRGLVSEDVVETVISLELASCFACPPYAPNSSLTSESSPLSSLDTRSLLSDCVFSTLWVVEVVDNWSHLFIIKLWQMCCTQWGQRVERWWRGGSHQV